MEENLYQPPKSEVSVNETHEDYKVASTGQRFANMLLDLVFIYVCAFLLGIALLLLGFENILGEFNEHLLGIIIMVMYYLPQEAIFGRTLGKMVTRTKVVSINGGQVTFSKALGRTLCRFIPFEAFTFLGGEGKPQGLHDKLPKTKVISLRKA